MRKQIKTINVKLQYTGFKPMTYIIPIEKRDNFVKKIIDIMKNRWSKGTPLEKTQFINSLIQEIYFISKLNVRILAELELGGEKYIQEEEKQKFIKNLIEKKEQWNRGEPIEFETAHTVSQYAEQIGHILLLYLQKKVQETESIKDELWEQIFSMFNQMPSRTAEILEEIENSDKNIKNMKSNNNIVSDEDKKNWETWYFGAKNLADEMVIVAEAMIKQKSEYLSVTDEYTAQICKESFNRQQKDLKNLYEEYVDLKNRVEDLPKEVGKRISTVQNDELYQELINTSL